MTRPAKLRCSSDRPWVRLDDAVAIVGITEFAQEQHGDVMYLQLPTIGEVVRAGDPIGVIQFFKSTSDLIAPVDGVVVEVNDAVRRVPPAVNRAPHGDGWLVRLQVDGAGPSSELLDTAGYDAPVAGQAE